MNETLGQGFEDNSSLSFERAVVIGAGIGGLAAAAALKDHCNEVIILERDEMYSEPTSRRGVPQSGQLHNLITRAQIHLEELMPGFIEGLRLRGAGDANVSEDTHVYELGIRMPERDMGLRLMSAWRPVIEHTARGIVLGADNISLSGLCRVNGVLATSAGNVRGVSLDREGHREFIDTPLVVDATGTGSQAHKWLEEIGYEAPQIETKKVNQWYTSILLKRPAVFDSDNSFYLTFPSLPNTRGGLISPIGDNNWYASVSGRLNDKLPNTFEEMKSYAATLEDPLIAQTLDNAAQLSAPNLFRKINASWRHYELLEEPLSGFLPIGDSIASLNPLFGQGMSVAAWQASKLALLLNTGHGTDGNTQELTKAYLEETALSCETAWDLGKLVDNSGENTRLSSIDWKELAVAIQADPEIHRRYVGIWHLIEPVSILTDQSFRARVKEITVGN